MKKILFTVFALILAFFAFAQETSTVDWNAVDEAMGIAGEMQEGDVYRFSLPRTDLQVTSQSVEIKPGFALGTWIALKPMTNGEEGEVVMMGDLVLTEEELNPVLTQLQEHGIRQTAIHKHLLEESPAIWWTHIEGHGDPVELVSAVRAALEQTGTPLESPDGDTDTEEIGFDTAQLDEIIGHEGSGSGGVYKFSIPRAETITAHGTEIPPAMGTAIALNFQAIGEEQAAINGDFVMLAEEVDGVIQALREHDIQVVALHNHMTSEEPRLFFLHFWQEGEATQLARGLRAALDQVNTSKGHDRRRK